MAAHHTVRTDPIGPIRVSPNGRHFTDPNGKPVFWLSDTQWEMFRLYEPETALRIRLLDATTRIFPDCLSRDSELFLINRACAERQRREADRGSAP